MILHDFKQHSEEWKQLGNKEFFQKYYSFQNDTKISMSILQKAEKQSVWTISYTSVKTDMMQL